MTIRRLTASFIVLFSLFCVTPSKASSPSDYEYCLIQGVNALDRGDDAGAARYFQLAHRLNPLADKPYQYLQLIERRRASLERGESSIPPLVTFQDLMRDGQDALARGERAAALEIFYKALIMDETDPRPLEYINLIKRLKEEQAVPVGRMKVVSGALDQFGESALPESAAQDVEGGVPEEQPLHQDHLKKDFEPSGDVSGNTDAVKKTVLRERPSVTAALAEASSVKGQEPSSSQVSVSPAAGSAGAAASFPIRKTSEIVETISLSDVMKEGPRPNILIDLGSALTLEGRRIQRFLVMDPSVVEVKTLSDSQIQIRALKRGTTFIHIWDDSGRSTIYTDVVLPLPSGGDLVLPPVVTSQHARPFRFLYSMDWGSYYYGHDVPSLERRTLSVQQGVGMDGETPYGNFDASAAFTGYGAGMQTTTYTMGLSQMPVPGTSDFSIRIFDARRYLSPLTLPGVRLRGGFIDTYFFRDILGLSLTHGQLQPAFGSLYGGGSGSRKAYVDALRVVVFPKDRDNQLAFNFAKGSGPGREDYLTREAYSVEGRKKIDTVLLTGETARDEKQAASLAGIEWADGRVRTSVHFRDIDKNFTTVTNPPSGQGELGAVWMGDVTWEKISANSSLDVFKDRLNPNPDDPEALNYDASARVVVPLAEMTSFDSSAHYVDTEGQAYPRQFSSGDARLSQSFGIWGDRKATAYVGTSYQKSRYRNSPQSEYDRCAVVTGVQIPVFKNVSCYANYEYSWLHEPYSEMDSNPNVFNTGVNYYHEFTKRLLSNWGIAYRNEEDVRGTNSFLAGEDSLMFSSGLSFNPIDDVNIFLDGRLRNVWAQIPDNPSYNDLDLRLGMRMALGTSFSWDPKGGISGFVFKDKDGDGHFTIRRDEGVPGVKIKLGDKEAVTDEKGWYRVEVRSKKVSVTPVLETIPPGFVFSTPASAEVDIFQGISKRVDFGLTTQSGIYGVVFVDKNGNGVPDQEDQFVGRIMFTLDGQVKQISDSRGAYFFKNVAPGKHTVALDMRSISVEFIPLVKLKTEVNVTEGTTYILHVPLKIKPAQPESSSSSPGDPSFRE